MVDSVARRIPIGLGCVFVRLFPNPQNSPISWENILLYGEYKLRPKWLINLYGLTSYKILNGFSRGS